jgi:membrane protein DedA with SNARE-associated domain
VDPFQQFLQDWGALGVFLAIIATGMGFPMPEELPVVLGGVLVHDINASYLRWWIMLLACVAGVVVGDSCLYFMGRIWGTKLLGLPFIKKRLMPPERFEHISQNFDKYGVKILLFARLTPGIRAPIFIVAGITKLPVLKFMVADGIYAIPGVTILFMLGYWFTDWTVELVKRFDNERSKVMPIIILVALLGVVAYFIYRHLRKPVVEGSPTEMPPVVGTVTEVVDQSLERVRDKLLHQSQAGTKPSAGSAPADKGKSSAGEKQPQMESDNGQPGQLPGDKPVVGTPSARSENGQTSHQPKDTQPHQGT